MQTLSQPPRVIDPEAMRLSGASDNIDKYAGARHSQIDELTGLPGRAATLARVKQVLAGAQRSHGMAALLFLDINGFKRVNDTFGHSHGDAILGLLGKRMRDCLRADEFIGRIGGDEFAVLLPDVLRNEDAAQVAERLCEAVESVAAEDSSSISLSVGTAIYPNDAASAEQWLSNADTAMYRAKRSGTRHCRYDPDWTKELTALHAISQRLRRANLERDFTFCFQPIFHVDGAVEGAEVLLRWVQKDAAVLTASQFIETACPTQTARLDPWVLAHAFRYAVAWRQKFGIPRLHVNLSIPDSTTLKELLTVIDDTPHAHRAAIALELNASAAGASGIDIQQVVESLAPTGVAVGLDGFEITNLNFSVLQMLPISFVKISRVLLSPDSGKHGMRAALALAREFKWDVIATHIESKRDCSVLSNLGVRYVQGYALAAPLAPLEFGTWMGKEPRSSYPAIQPF